ncbi:MAG TPA: FAD-linked oxidase C-terminal domain-containing protein [Acidimicrobiales bacterium]|nr:FAD-linked oxidase C-terminal domain-containing protein [Acidimicrobiales bacterium]
MYQTRKGARLAASAPVDIRPSQNGDSSTPDVRAFVAELSPTIEGEVRFSAGDRAMYATDSSSYRQVPIGVVIPKTIDDVVATVEACRRHGLPVLSRGAGTSLAGQCCNAAVVMDMSKHVHRLLELDRENRLARVQPGLVLDVLRQTGQSGTPGMTFGPTPSTHVSCTIGGMIGNNSCGNYSIMSEFYGAGPRMAHNVAEMEVLTYDGLRLRVGKTSEAELGSYIAAGGRRGQIYRDLRDLRDRYLPLIRERFPDFPRRVSGYNLDGLLPEKGFDLAYSLVGSESTCVTVLEATLHLVPAKPARSLVVIGFRDLYEAGAQIMAAREHKPVALEGFDLTLIEDNRKLGKHVEELDLLPPGEGWLLAEFGGESKEETDEQAASFMAHMRKGKGYCGEKLYDDPEAEKKIWEVRESGLGATAYVPGSPDTYEGWEDSAVPPERLPGYLKDLRGLFNRYGYACSLYGHFGQGCVHTRIDWDPHTVEGVRTWRRFVDDAAELVLSYGGSLSGEHGDGQSRGELLERMYGKELVDAFRAFKAVWDPEGKMNPGKVVDPYPITSNLRLGPDYSPLPAHVHFSHPKDHGSFAHAATRCVGVGKCRRLDGGTMCPSFMVTHEEKHSTRGRARLLHEMMRRDSEVELWKSTDVRDALDLCLSCKGCKSDCPVNVDMATYKAEFLSHHYRGRLRPRPAYAMGLIYWWARAGSRLPRLANAALTTPLVSDVLKWAGGIDRHRPAPTLARQTFTDWFAHHQRPDGSRPQVLVWPDTFTNFFHPGPARATVEVLEAAGFDVILPSRPLCCGRPLYDYGMLDLAQHLLRQVLDELRPVITSGIPVVGVEPSCLAVFRDELPELFPGDLDARRLSQQSFMLSEFLQRHVPDWELPKLTRKAVVHGHCHHKAVMGFDAELAVLSDLGLDVEMPDSGCCGLAGSFGFEHGDKYAVSIAAGERVLLPKVREADDETLIVTDGFSCRTQIEHNTTRKPVHLAEVIALALRDADARACGA